MSIQLPQSLCLYSYHSVYVYAVTTVSMFMQLPQCLCLCSCLKYYHSFDLYNAKIAFFTKCIFMLVGHLKRRNTNCFENWCKVYCDSNFFWQWHRFGNGHQFLLKYGEVNVTVKCWRLFKFTSLEYGRTTSTLYSQWTLSGVTATGSSSHLPVSDSLASFYILVKSIYMFSSLPITKTFLNACWVFEICYLITLNNVIWSHPLIIGMCRVGWATCTIATHFPIGR